MPRLSDEAGGAPGVRVAPAGSCAPGVCSRMTRDAALARDDASAAAVRVARTGRRALRALLERPAERLAEGLALGLMT